MPVKIQTGDIASIPNPIFQNPVFYSSTNISQLPQTSNSESEYEEPSIRAQLDGCERTSCNDAKYQSSNVDNDYENVV